MNKVWTFDEWMADVDRLCVARYGLSTADLPDMGYYEAYDDGVTPKEMLAEIANMFDDEFGDI